MSELTGPTGTMDGAPPAEKPTLRSLRLVLRPVRDEDAADLVALDADEEVRRWVDMPAAPTERQITDEMIPRWREFDRLTPQVGFWVAQSEGVFAGWFHLRPPKHVAEKVAAKGDLELGYRLRRELWGKGLATEGSRLLLTHAFDTLRAPRVTAACLEGNVASMRVMEKIGMSRVATREYKPGQPALVYGIARGRRVGEVGGVNRVSQPVRLATGPGSSPGHTPGAGTDADRSGTPSGRKDGAS